MMVGGGGGDSKRDRRRRDRKILLEGAGDRCALASKHVPFATFPTAQLPAYRATHMLHNHTFSTANQLHSAKHA